MKLLRMCEHTSHRSKRSLISYRPTKCAVPYCCLFFNERLSFVILIWSSNSTLFSSFYLPQKGDTRQQEDTAEFEINFII